MVSGYRADPLLKVQGFFFGDSVSLSDAGDVLAVGAPNNLDGGNAYVRVFDNSSGDWVQRGDDFTDSGHLYGDYVKLSGDGSVVVIGSEVMKTIEEF